MGPVFDENASYMTGDNKTKYKMRKYFFQNMYIIIIISFVVSHGIIQQKLLNLMLDTINIL